MLEMFFFKKHVDFLPCVVDRVELLVPIDCIPGGGISMYVNLCSLNIQINAFWVLLLYYFHSQQLCPIQPSRHRLPTHPIHLNVKVCGIHALVRLRRS